jgi:PAS domain S-box-containing protein
VNVIDPSPSCTPPPEILDAGLLAALLEQIEEGLYIVDRERRIVYWNRGAEQITGYLAQEVVGRYCQRDLLVHCDSEGVVLCGSRCPLVAVMEDGQPRHAEVFLRHRDGHRLPVRVRGRALRDGAGQIVGAVELFVLAVAPGRRERPARPADADESRTPLAVPREFGEWQLDHALRTLRRFGIPVGWIALELNDPARWLRRFGPGFREAAMCLIAETVDANLGSRDLLVRWGPAEFRILVEQASPVELPVLSKKLAALVGASTLDWWGDPLRLGVSCAAALAVETDTTESLERRLRSQLERVRPVGSADSTGRSTWEKAEGGAEQTS